MRLAAIVAAILSLSAGPGLAQDPALLSVSPVSLSWPSDLAVRATGDLPNDPGREGSFAIGQPEGSGFRAVPLTGAAPRAVVRSTQNRARKPFSVPWQSGVFQ
ncbi:MAG: hypothetical protein ACT4OK_13120 [Gemmobacter sp.]